MTNELPRRAHFTLLPFRFAPGRAFENVGHPRDVPMPRGGHPSSAGVCAEGLAGRPLGERRRCGLW